jgi:hypothetical protein
MWQTDPTETKPSLLTSTVRRTKAVQAHTRARTVSAYAYTRAQVLTAKRTCSCDVEANPKGTWAQARCAMHGPTRLKYCGR